MTRDPDIATLLPLAIRARAAHHARARSAAWVALIAASWTALAHSFQPWVAFVLVSPWAVLLQAIGLAAAVSTAAYIVWPRAAGEVPPAHRLRRNGVAALAAVALICGCLLGLLAGPGPTAALETLARALLIAAVCAGAMGWVFSAATTAVATAGSRHDPVRAVLDTMATGVVVRDHRGAIVDCNAAACRMLGLDAEQLMERAPLDPRWAAFQEDGSACPGEQHYALQTLHSGQPVMNQVMGIVASDGERRWLEVNTRSIENVGSDRRAVVSTFSDITASSAIKAALKLERARLAAALDGTAAGAWHWLIADATVSVDQRWAQIVGAEVAGVSMVRIGDWMRRLHPEDAKRARETASSHLRGLSERFDAELRVRNDAGSWVWVHCRGRVGESAADGTPLSMFGTLMDITARKEAAAAAAAEQFKLKRLFDLAPLGIALASDADGRVLDCNQSLCDMLRMERSSVIGHSLLEATSSDGQPAWAAHAAELCLAGRVGPYERAYLRGDGSPVAALVSAQRVAPIDADGSAALWVIVQDISERKAMEEGLQREARTDKLTGLANRAALMERLESAVRRARTDPRAGFGLLFLDFDRFKLVNDTLGHAAGDELLRQIAERLRRSVRGRRVDNAAQSFVARIGGDEFVVLVDGTADLVEIERIARRLLGALAAPYNVRGSEMLSSASIGVVSSAQAEMDASAILRNADTAMYEAKRRGRGMSVVFDEGMHARLRREVEIERHLRHAIAAGEIALVYQPIIDLETGQMSSIEALLRWNSAALGEVPPSEFIPIAEDCGAIIEIGEWVLANACREFAVWAAAHPQSTATISVNLSRVQLGQPEHLLAYIESTLDACGLAPERVQLEVTERDVMRDPTAVLVLMRHLRAIGVRLAMDDFGTGTSSLACLRDYPFDVIKIDRTFVGDLDSNAQVMAMVHATMMLIENLGMISVAEGVETRAQAAILQSVGCRHGQGWLFGKPAGLAEL